MKASVIWDKVFKSGLSKFYKGCLPQNLISPQKLITLSHVLLSTNENLLVNIRTAQIPNNSFKKLLIVKIDCKLHFKDHIGSICKKAITKLNALTRVSAYMNPDEGLLRLLYLKNYCKKTILSRYPTEISRFLPQKCSEPIRGYLQKL